MICKNQESATYDLRSAGVLQGGSLHVIQGAIQMLRYTTPGMLLAWPAGVVEGECFSHVPHGIKMVLMKWVGGRE